MSLAHLEALLIMAAVWLLQLWIFVGFGLRISRWIGGTEFSLRYPLTPVWLGWCVTLFVLQTCQIVLPITAVAFPLALVAATALIWGDAAYAGRLFRRLLQSVSGLNMTVLTVLGGWCACKAMLPPNNWDSGVYHFSSVRWLNEYALVPGLVNLHGRLAFNQSFFHYVAFLNGIPPYNRGHNFANSFLIMILLAEIILRFSSRIGKNRLEISSSEWFASLGLLPAILLMISVGRISSPAPDTTCSVLQYLFFLWILRTVSIASLNRCYGQFAFLAASMITVKLSNLVFAAVPVLWCAADLRNQSAKASRNTLASLMSAITLVVWCARSLVVSGCLIYPLGFTRVELDWSATPQQIQAEHDLIKSCGRLCPTPADAPIRSSGDRVLYSNDWIVPWLTAVWADDWSTVFYPSLIGITTFFSSLLLRRRTNRLQQSVSDRRLQRAAKVAAAGSLFSIVFWFSQAPDPRFIVSILAIFAVSGSVALSQSLVLKSALWRFFVIALLPSATIMAYVIAAIGTFRVMSNSGFCPTPMARLTEVEVNSKLVVLTPVDNDQSWDAQLPCSPYIVPGLQLRGSTLQSGFSVSPILEE